MVCSIDHVMRKVSWCICKVYERNLAEVIKQFLLHTRAT